MKSFTLFLSILVVATLAGCKKGTTDPEPDRCARTEVVKLHKVLHVAYPAESFELRSQPAPNDCHGSYSFAFRWADPARRFAEVPGQEEMPPLNSLDHSFGPYDEYAYFPHPKATYSSIATAEHYGQGWWIIVFDIGNKNSGMQYTRHSMFTSLSYEAQPMDSVEVYCVIETALYK
jgi:hypothetical protein